MFYIIGLGNPGPEYTDTRHNTGRMVLETFRKKNGFSDFTLDKKSNALVSNGTIEKKKMTLLLPETFMNLSGKSVAPLVKSKKDLENIVVVYDDLDLPLGKIKISYDRSSGGHNGVESIIKAVKSQAFTRIRVGVAPTTPSGKTKKPTGEKVVIDFLMKPFRPQEEVIVKKIMKEVDEAIVLLVSEGRPKAMSVCN